MSYLHLVYLIRFTQNQIWYMMHFHHLNYVYYQRIKS